MTTRSIPNRAVGRTTRTFRKLAARLKRERRVCWLCRQPIDYSVPSGSSPDSFTVDHVLPRSTHPELAEVYSNLEAAHRDCNDRRGNNLAVAALGEGEERQW